MQLKRVFAAIVACTAGVSAITIPPGYLQTLGLSSLPDFIDAYINLFSGDFARAGAKLNKIKTADPVFFQNLISLQNAYDTILGYDPKKYVPKGGVDAAYARFSSGTRMLIAGKPEAAKKLYTFGIASAKSANVPKTLQNSLEALSYIRCHYLPTSLAKLILEIDVANSVTATITAPSFQEQAPANTYFYKLVQEYTKLGDELKATASIENGDKTRVSIWLNFWSKSKGVKNLSENQFKNDILNSINKCSINSGQIIATPFSPFFPIDFPLPPQIMTADLKASISRLFSAIADSFETVGGSPELVDGCANSNYIYPYLNASCMFAQVPGTS